MLKLRNERLQRGWSQTQLSHLTGIASPDLSAIEREIKPSYPGWRQRLTRVFGIPEEELFAQVDEVSTEASARLKRADP